MSTVIGFDQSYTGFGYSVYGDSKKRAFKQNPQGPEYRLDDVRKWVRKFINDVHGGDGRVLDLIVMEGYANGAKFGREIAGELGAAVKFGCIEAWGPPLIVPPTSLKKFVTGKGNAKKNEMIAHVFKKWGVMFSDDNQADAFALEKFGKAYLQHTDARVSELDDVVNLTKYEIEAIEAVRKGK